MADEKRTFLLKSFSLAKGKPRDVGCLFIDLRTKIRNPWHIPELREKTGLDPEVQAFVAACKGYEQVKIIAKSMIKARSGLLLGCYGGRHRSVAVAEMLADFLRAAYPDVEVVVKHRDLEASNGE